MLAVKTEKFINSVFVNNTNMKGSEEKKKEENERKNEEEKKRGGKEKQKEKEKVKKVEEKEEKEKKEEVKEKKEEIKDKEENEEEVLKRNIKQFLSSANLVYKTEDFTSATILYFKALFSIFDFIILRDRGKIPKDHSERFRILELNYFNLYLVLDRIYPIYRNTYTTRINKETCKRIKENVERVIKEQKIFEDN